MLVAGQTAEDPQDNRMGKYNLQDVDEHWVNSRPVFKQEGKERYMYHDNSGYWLIGSKESMLVGEASGWMSVVDTALRPDLVEGGWQVWAADNNWVAAPKLSLVLATPANIAAFDQQHQLEEQELKRLAREGGDMLVAGQTAEDPQDNRMGKYNLQDVDEHWVNSRPVFKQEGKERYMYHDNSGYWLIGSKESMLVGEASGWMSVVDTALRPDLVEGGWQVWAADNNWVAAPKIRVVSTN